MEATALVLQCAQDVDGNPQITLERRGDQVSPLHLGRQTLAS